VFTHTYVYTLILYNERPWSNDILVAKSIPVLRSWGSVFFPYINMNWPQVYVCPPDPEPTSHFFPHPIPLGCPRALALGALFHTSNLHWPSVLHMIVYMFQCYSLKSSHPCLFPLSPKVCSLHLCFPCCPACRIIGTIFLNSIYMC